MEANSGKRIIAFLIDTVILSVATRMVLSLVYRSGGGYQVASIFTNCLIQFFYAGYFYSKNSATPGKMALNLQVVTESGDKLGFVRAGLRDGLGKLISGMILGIGFFMAFFRPDSQALHDIMFKTRVIEKNEYY
jgi:uncharacterized RDD family membrane protein YckC